MIVPTVGIIYFLKNSSMKGLIKIGFTTKPIEERLKKLNSTGVPVPFQVVAYFIVNNPEETEKSIHKRLNVFRVSKNREFFKCELSKALELSLKIIINNASDSEIVLKDDLNEKNELNEESIKILQFLMRPQFRSEGLFKEDIAGFLGMKIFSVEISLSILHEMGLVEMKKHKQLKSYHTDIWKLSAIKGVKYLHDKNLLEKDVMEEYEKHYFPVSPGSYEYNRSMNKQKI